MVHSMSFTAANVHDSQEIDKVLHGEEKVVSADKAYADKQRKRSYRERGDHLRNPGESRQMKAAFNEPKEKKQKVSVIESESRVTVPDMEETAEAQEDKVSLTVQECGAD